MPAISSRSSLTNSGRKHRQALEARFAGAEVVGGDAKAPGVGACTHFGELARVAEALERIELQNDLLRLEAARFHGLGRGSQRGFQVARIDLGTVDVQIAAQLEPAGFANGAEPAGLVEVEEVFRPHGGDDLRRRLAGASANQGFVPHRPTAFGVDQRLKSKSDSDVQHGHVVFEPRIGVVVMYFSHDHSPSRSSC